MNHRLFRFGKYSILWLLLSQNTPFVLFSTKTDWDKVLENTTELLHITLKENVLLKSIKTEFSWTLQYFFWADVLTRVFMFVLSYRVLRAFSKTHTVFNMSSKTRVYGCV